MEFYPVVPPQSNSSPTLLCYVFFFIEVRLIFNSHINRLSNWCCYLKPTHSENVWTKHSRRWFHFSKKYLRHLLHDTSQTKQSGVHSRDDQFQSISINLHSELHATRNVSSILFRRKNVFIKTSSCCCCIKDACKNHFLWELSLWIIKYLRD